MDVDEVLTRGGSPVAHHQWLDVRDLERPLEQRVVVKIDLADRDVVCRPPIRIHLVQHIGTESRVFHSRVPWFNKTRLARRRWWRGAPLNRARKKVSIGPRQRPIRLSLHLTTGYYSVVFNALMRGEHTADEAGARAFHDAPKGVLAPVTHRALR